MSDYVTARGLSAEYPGRTNSVTLSSTSEVVRGPFADGGLAPVGLRTGDIFANDGF